MKMIYRKIVLFTSWMMLFLVVQAASEQDVMKQANEAYRNQKYNEAVKLYLQIANDGNEGSVLFYNLGNAYYKSDHNAEALLWYERALRLDPSNEDIKHNIAFVNRQLVDRIDPLPQLFITRWWNAVSMCMTANSWAWLSILFCVLMLSSVVILLIAHRSWLRSTGFGIAVLTFFLSVLSIVFANTESRRYEKNPQAIVMQPVLNAKNTPNSSDKDIFVIHEGLKVGVTDTLGDWVEIKLPNGEKGWVQEKGISVI